MSSAPAASAAATPGQSIASWSVNVAGANEEVRFFDQFGNDTRLLSVSGDPRTIEIVARGDRAANPEFAVGGLDEPLGSGDDHAADGLGAGNVTVVVDLDAGGRFFQAEGLGEADEKPGLCRGFGEPAAERNAVLDALGPALPADEFLRFAAS